MIHRNTQHNLEHNVLSNSKSYDSIDLMKLVFAFAVVAIHTELLHGVPALAKWTISSLFFRTAVPFFMITSGFFLGLKIRKSGTACIKNYRAKLFPILLLYSTVSMFLNAVVIYHNTHNAIGTLIKSIQSFVFYPKGAMWFVFALIISSYILEFVLKKRINLLLSFFISLMLFMFALLCNNYFFLIENTSFANTIIKFMSICLSTRNGLFLFIYMLIGYFISSQNALNLSTRRILLIFSFGFAIFLFEIFFLYEKTALDDSSLFVSHLVIVPALILCLTKTKKIIRNHLTFRSISTVIYYIHPIFSILIGTYIGVPDGIVKFAMVSLLSIAVWYLTKNSNSRFVATFLR